MPAVLSETTSTTTDHIIDLDADPFVPDGWKVEEHRKGGAFKWDVGQVELFLDQAQRQNGGYMKGYTFRKLLAGKPVLNANVLDYLLKNPHLIPEEWMSKNVYFWGTIYSARGGWLCVRSLYWRRGRWDWYVLGLDGSFHGFSPAAVRAS